MNEQRSSSLHSLSDWLTTAEAAAIAGIEEQSVRNAINRGRLQAEEKSGVKLIHRTELERYRKEAKRGRPSSKGSDGDSDKERSEE